MRPMPRDVLVRLALDVYGVRARWWESRARIRRRCVCMGELVRGRLVHPRGLWTMACELARRMVGR
jgi:hypothetical protein